MQFLVHIYKEKQKHKQTNNHSITSTNVKAKMSMVYLCQYIVQENLFKLFFFFVERRFKELSHVIVQHLYE